MPEISVILPIYKVEKYLNICVDSILEQTFTDFELIMVDDGSPDFCGTICEEYARIDPRVRVIHQKNMGLSEARNTGLDAAVGNYIAFIDSDDIINIYYLEELFHTLTENSADVSACNYFTFHDGERIDYKRKVSGKEFVVLGKTEAIESIYSDEKDSIYVTAWGFLFKKHLFENLRFPPGKIGEDLSLIPRVIYRADRVAWIKNALYGYRQRKDSITYQKYSVRIFDNIEALDQGIVFFFFLNEKELSEVAQLKKTKVLSRYTLIARKYGFYHQVPPQYKMSSIRAFLNLKRLLPYNSFSYIVYQIYPRYIWIEEHFRRLLEIIGLKDPQDRWK